MYFSTLAATTAIFASFALGAPAPSPGRGNGTHEFGRPNGPPGYPWAKNGTMCMSDEDAHVVADTFRSLIRGYTKEQALLALTEDFVDYSSAVSIIINRGAEEPNDVTEPIFSSREEFMRGHGTQKPIPFETLGVWHDCNGTVSMKWMTDRSAMGQRNETARIPVIGLAILETEPAEEGNPYNYRIHTLHSEFNTAAWLVNLGVFKPAGPVAPVKRSAEPMKWWEVGMI